MKTLLQEITDIPGVTGSCIYDKTVGSLCSQIKSDLSVELTESVGTHFVRLMQMGAMNGVRIRSAHFRFDRYNVLGFPLDSGTVLFTICEPEANCSFVASTAALIASEMGEERAAGIGVEAGIAPVRKEPDPRRDMEREKARKEALLALRPEFDEITAALAVAIGPVAPVVMQEYVDRWSKEGPVEPNRLDRLIILLSDEIGDQDLSDEFQVTLQSLF